MKMISRRDFLKASAVVGATAAMTACGGSSSTSTAASSVAASSAAASSAAATNGSANIGVCIYQFADNFMTLYRSDLEEYLKDMGYSVTIMDGKNDQNTQTEQINTFLQQGVDVLVINPVQTTSAQTIVDTVKPSETPIVFINREPDKSVLDSYADKCCYVGADARQVDLSLVEAVRNKVLNVDAGVLGHLGNRQRRDRTCDLDVSRHGRSFRYRMRKRPIQHSTGAQ